MDHNDPLYRPPAPLPTTPVKALLRGMFRSDRDMISLMPQSAYRTMVAEVGWTRRKIILVNDPEIVQLMMTAEVAAYPKSDLMADALAPLVRDGVFVFRDLRRRVLQSAAISAGRLALSVCFMQLPGFVC